MSAVFPYNTYLDGLKNMRKDALTITITTLVLGIFGAFFRWLQLLNAFEADTGLAKPGAGTSTAFVVYCVAAVAVIVFLMLAWLRRYAYPEDPAGALGSASSLPTVLAGLLGAVILLTALLLIFSADQSRFPVMQRIFSALAILSGVSLPFILGKKAAGADSVGGVVSVVPVLFACFWLVFSYRVNSEDPVLWAYCVEILAIAATALAFYHIAAYFYGRAKPVQALFLVQLAAFLDVTTLSDGRVLGLSVIFAACAAFLLMTEFVMISNLREKPEKDEGEAPEQQR